MRVVVRATDMLDRSEKGHEEIQSRQHKLTARMRMLLVLIDGRQTVSQVADQALKIGLPNTAVNELLSSGFLSIANPSMIATPANTAADDDRVRFENYRKASQFMNETIVDALGIKSFFFTLKIGKTSTIGDLRELVDDYAVAMNKALGAETADLFVGRMKKLVNR